MNLPLTATLILVLQQFDLQELAEFNLLASRGRSLRQPGRLFTKAREAGLVDVEGRAIDGESLLDALAVEISWSTTGRRPVRSHDLTGDGRFPLVEFARRWKAAGEPRKLGRLARAWSWLLSLAPHRDRAAAGQPEAKAPLCECGRPGEATCTECLVAFIRDHLAELTPHEVLAMARGAALRDGERHLAKVLHAILLLDLMGSLDAVAASCDKALVAIQWELGHEPAGRVH